MSHKVHLGPYQLTERIAKSDIAISYSVNVATGAGAERLAALKILNPLITNAPGFAERLIDQVRLAEQLSHANLAQTWDFGCRDGVYYLLLEFVEGVPLTVLMKQGPVPVEIAVHIALEIAGGLSYAHARRDKRGATLGVVHGDIRSRNVLVSNSGAVKVVDFGVARARKINGEDPVPPQSRDVDLFAYADPRHARGEEPTVASDTFSVLALLWSMLTGRRLFEGGSYDEVLANAREGVIPSIQEFVPDLHEGLALIIDRGLNIDSPDRALSTASGVRNALTEWQRSHAPDFGRHAVKDYYKTLLQEPIATRHTRPLTRREFAPDDAASVIFKADSAAEDSGSNFDLERLFRGFDPLREDNDLVPESTAVFSPKMSLGATLSPPSAPDELDDEEIELLDDDLVEAVEDEDDDTPPTKPLTGLAAALAAKKGDGAAKPASGLAAALAAKGTGGSLPPRPASPAKSALPERPAGGLPPRPTAGPPSLGRPSQMPPPAPRGSTQVISPVALDDDDLLASLVDESPAPPKSASGKERAEAALAALSQFAESGPIAALVDEDFDAVPTQAPTQAFSLRGRADSLPVESTTAGKMAVARPTTNTPAPAADEDVPSEPTSRVVPSVPNARSAELVRAAAASLRPEEDTPVTGNNAVGQEDYSAPVSQTSAAAENERRNAPKAEAKANYGYDPDSLGSAVYEEELDASKLQVQEPWDDEFDPNAGMPAPKKRSPLSLAAIVLLVLAAIGGGYYFMTKSDGTNLPGAARTTGGIRVTSTPAGARIIIDDKDTGLRTPATFTDFANGSSVIVRAELDGFEQSMPSTVTIPSGTIQEVQLRLNAVPHLVQVATTPPGATIYVDGVHAGVSPATIGPFTSNAALGVNVSFQLNGYTTTSIQHTWQPGVRDGAINVTLERVGRRR